MPIGILSLFISAISVAPLLVATVKKWVGWWWATAHYVLVTASVGLIVCAALYDRSGIQCRIRQRSRSPMNAVSEVGSVNPSPWRSGELRFVGRRLRRGCCRRRGTKSAPRPDSELRALMDLHFFGPAALTRAALPYLRAHRSGWIVQVTSTGGRLSFAGVPAYSATEYALEGWSEGLAHEVVPHRLRRRRHPAAQCPDPGLRRGHRPGLASRSRQPRPAAGRPREGRRRERP